METTVVTLTAEALSELSALEQGQGLENAALRIWVAGGGCSGLQYGMALDDSTPEPEDTEYLVEGRRVYIDADSLPLLQGIVVDYIEEDGFASEGNKAGFKITNPNAVKSCGCGSSFQADDNSGAQGCGGCGCGS